MKNETLNAKEVMIVFVMAIGIILFFVLVCFLYQGTFELSSANADILENKNNLSQSPIMSLSQVILVNNSAFPYLQIKVINDSQFVYLQCFESKLIIENNSIICRK